MTFNELNISKQILMALEDAGFEQPTPIQERAFPVIRSGKDVIGIAQTGTGKTLASDSFADETSLCAGKLPTCISDCTYP